MLKGSWSLDQKPCLLTPPFAGFTEVVEKESFWSTHRDPLKDSNTILDGRWNLVQKPCLFLNTTFCWIYWGCWKRELLKYTHRPIERQQHHTRWEVKPWPETTPLFKTTVCWIFWGCQNQLLFKTHLMLDLFRWSKPPCFFRTTCGWIFWSCGNHPAFFDHSLLAVLRLSGKRCSTVLVKNELLSGACARCLQLLCFMGRAELVFTELMCCQERECSARRP